MKNREKEKKMLKKQTYEKVKENRTKRRQTRKKKKQNKGPSPFYTVEIKRGFSFPILVDMFPCRHQEFL